MRTNRQRSEGFTLAEVLTAVAIVGIMVSVTIPQFAAMRRRLAVRAAAREIASALREARSLAVSRARNVAVRFDQRPLGWTQTLYEDGDFDGVRSDDIRRGVDPLVRPPRLLMQGIGTATIAMPIIEMTDPDTGDPIDRADDPVRFGNASSASFSPTGSGTAGSVYVSDGFDNVAIVRVFGTTGRVRSMIYDAGTQRWNQ